jgi:hypothetical protein
MTTIFGEFPRNQVFLVQVTLNINDTKPNARIILSGAGASGQADRDVIPAFRPQAQQFGTVRIWMGFPHTGGVSGHERCRPAQTVVSASRFGKCW